MPTCKRWFRKAMQLDNDIVFEKDFYFYENGFAEFCKSLTSQFTTHLKLCRPTLEIVEILTNSGSFKKLTNISMTNHECNTSIACKMLDLVSKSEISKNVKYLNLGCRTQDNGLQIIANSSHFNQLETLITFWSGFTYQGIKILASHPKFANLSHLEMTGLNAEEFKLICNSPNFANITYLDVGMGSIGNEGMQYYASSPYLKKVNTFILDRANFDSEGVRIMCSSDNATSIQVLEFEYTYIGDEGVKYLAQSPNMKNLTRLDITRTNSGDQCVDYIIKSPYLKNLHSIRYEHHYSEDPYYEGKFIGDEAGDKLYNCGNSFNEEEENEEGEDVEDQEDEGDRSIIVSAISKYRDYDTKL